MSDETPTISIPLRRMTQAELDAFLEKAADILRGNVDHSEFRGYVFALLFYKRINDCYDEEGRFWPSRRCPTTAAPHTAAIRATAGCHAH